MPDEVSVRQLRSRTAELLRRVEAGETLRLTVGGRPVAQLVPVASRATWVSGTRAHTALVQADAGLRRELDALLSDVVRL